MSEDPDPTHLSTERHLASPSGRASLRVLVVGAGLSGLVAARALAAHGARVSVAEARARVGGRIRTTDVGIDLGPAWLWPEANPRLAALVSDLGLEIFPQHVEGAGIHESPSGRVRIPTWAQGSMRMVGGMAALTDSLMGQLAAVDVRTGTRVSRLELTEAGVWADLESEDGKPGEEVEREQASPRQAVQGRCERLELDAVLLAAPPRVLAETIAFEPTLPDEVVARWAATSTWMAGHAKFVARYETPFWRERGWSGMVSSQIGPLVEVHDASPHRGPDGALFGFVGVPAPGRRSLGREGLVAECVAQLGRLFGSRASDPVSTALMDWAEEPWTARAADREGFGDHPHPQPSVVPGRWAPRLALAGSEFSSTVPGYLEGAVQGAEVAVARILGVLREFGVLRE